MKSILITFLLCCSFSVYAVSLYGVELQTAKRDQLRSAVKNAGLKLQKEAGKDGFFDQYKSDSAISVSSSLYLGFVKKTQDFAFAEYEFKGLKQPAMMLHLQQKYGKPVQVKAKFVSDKRYSWSQGGITIHLYQDWAAYRTRLSYINGAALNVLHNERRTLQTQKNIKKILISEQSY